MIARAIVRQPNKLYKNPLIVPVVLPDIEDVKRFALGLHTEKDEKEGIFAGWSFRYIPKRAQAPLDSSLTFTPATFVMGAWPIWSISIDWERGDENEPYITVIDKGIIKQ